MVKGILVADDTGLIQVNPSRSIIEIIIDNYEGRQFDGFLAFVSIKSFNFSTQIIRRMHCYDSIWTGNAYASSTNILL